MVKFFFFVNLKNTKTVSNGFYTNILISDISWLWIIILCYNLIVEIKIN